MPPSGPPSNAPSLAPPLAPTTTTTFLVAGPLTQPRVAALQAELLAALPGRADVTLDLAEITEVDVAGLQLLLSTRRWAESNGRRHAFLHAPPALATLCDALGQPLDELIGSVA
jgi:ABC-type transporter Mla MlaB component